MFIKWNESKNEKYFLFFFLHSGKYLINLTENQISIYLEN